MFIIRLAGNFEQEAAQNAEAQNVLQYYNDNRSAYLKERSPNEILKTIAIHKSCYAVDGSDQSIVACAMQFDHRNGQIQEIGAALSLVTGFNFAYLLTCVLVLTQEIFFGEAITFRHVALIRTNNTRAQEIAKRAGFAPISMTPQDAQDLELPPEYAVRLILYELDRGRLPEMANHLLDLEENPTLTNHQTDDRTALVLEIPILQKKMLRRNMMF